MGENFWLQIVSLLGVVWFFWRVLVYKTNHIALQFLFIRPPSFVLPVFISLP